MFIQTENTPNPSTLKFLPGRAVMPQGTANYEAVTEADNSPLAQRLFQVDGVRGVFLGADFITVTKAPDQNWANMKPLLLGAIMEHLTSGKKVIVGVDAEATGGAEDDVSKKVRELLDTRIRPAVAQDGGDIVFHKFENGVVYLHMRGACSGCPSSTETLKYGIENMLKHYVPEVREVRAL